MDKMKCRWLDRMMENVCRNQDTHPSVIDMEVNGEKVHAFCEPACNPCEGCGYEEIGAGKPAWDEIGAEA